MDWFSIEQVDDDTFIISENKHWEETHCYLLLGLKIALLIDTGLGVSNIKNIVDTITDLPVKVVTTHVHWDHIGGHQYFSDISVYETEKSWIQEKFPLPLSVVKNNLTCKPCDFPVDFNINSYQIYQGRIANILHDNDVIDLGDRLVKVIHTSGHSPGHCCFYEPKRKYLYSGDLIYKGCLDIYYPTTDIFDFWNSIKKIQSLDVTKILPAHHSLDITIDIIDRIADAFETLQSQDKLKQGEGIFCFGDFQIHI